ncbi:unnamed protein product [Closterium sp. Yama58-4]|nr:unnamed protein product [Closterium sp. Yama58-4]
MISAKTPPLAQRAGGAASCSAGRRVSACGTAASAEVRVRASATRGRSAPLGSARSRPFPSGCVCRDLGGAARTPRHARAIIAGSAAPADSRGAASQSSPSRPRSTHVAASGGLHAAGAGEAEEAAAAEREVAWARGEEGVWSVVIPTYNRLPILTKCLRALEQQRGWRQAGVRRYEVVVVDDGSHDGTVRALAAMGVASCEGGAQGAEEGGPGGAVDGGERDAAVAFPHVRVVQQQHAGATAARNLGVRVACGSTMVFIDSDMVVCPDFLAAHARALAEARSRFGDERTFTYGRVVNTSNFDDPMAEPFKLTDYSAAFFATGNVHCLQPLLFSPNLFSMCLLRVWGGAERLRQCGARIWQCPEAVGFHWHPPFHPSQLPALILQERQRGENGVRFFLKHRTLNVRLMVQMTPFHAALWFLLTLGGALNERSLAPLLAWLVQQGHPGVAMGVLSPVLNWHTVQATHEEVQRLRKAGVDV